jgi:hypothetical protein
MMKRFDGFEDQEQTLRVVLWDPLAVFCRLQHQLLQPFVSHSTAVVRWQEGCSVSARQKLWGSWVGIYDEGVEKE